MVQACRQLAGVLAGVFHHQQRGRVSLDKSHAAAVFLRAPHHIEDHLVDQLHRGRAGFEKHLRGLQRLGQLPKVRHQQHRSPGPDRQRDLRLCDDAESALRTGDQPAQVDVIGFETSIQVVSPHAAQDLRKPPVDLLAILASQPEQLFVDPVLAGSVLFALRRVPPARAILSESPRPPERASRRLWR